MTTNLLKFGNQGQHKLGQASTWRLLVVSSLKQQNLATKPSAQVSGDLEGHSNYTPESR